MTKKILVIEDEQDVREMTRAVLATRNYDIRLAGDGEEGLAMAEEERPDLIICDLMMPRVSGLEVIKRVRRNQRLRTIPIIIVSAVGSQERPREFWIQSLGVDDYILKPYDPLDLLGRVEYIFRRADYVSTRQETPQPADSHDPADATRPPFDPKDLTPSEVVRTFVESWNKQDFGTEYNCLGEEMLGGTELHDYVNRRRKVYVDERDDQRTQRVLQIEEEKISLNVAKVTILREDSIKNEKKQRRESYGLKKTHRGWKIVSCRSVKS